MNSKELQESFPEVYEKFFSKCARVVSAPHVFFWTGDFSNFYGGLAACSKIPLRFYVGLEEVSGGDTEVVPEFLSYVNSLSRFEKSRLDSYIHQDIGSYLRGRLSGGRVHFLSELPLGVSLGGLGAISACLAALTGGTSSRVVRSAEHLVKSLQRGRQSSATACAAMSKSPYPIIHCQDQGKAWSKPLNAMADLPSEPLWPIDFGLIFTGQLVQGGAVITCAEQIKGVSEKMQREGDKLIGTHQRPFWDDYLAMLSHVSLQNIVALKKLLSRSENGGDLGFFFSTLNQYQNLLHFIGVTTPRIDEVYSLVHKVADNSAGQSGSGCKITGVGKGGELLFALPYGQARQEIEGALAGLAADTDTSISLDYASWKDGVESRGLVVEQDVAASVFSRFVKKGSCILRVFEGGGYRVEVVPGGNGILSRADIVLDLERRKIFFKGRGVDSSLIKSQRATVEILGRLLDAPKRAVSNAKIPGSYGRSRFDLQSKIIAPLAKLTGLEFEISGGMYDNFTLKLKPFDLKIALSRKAR